MDDHWVELFKQLPDFLGGHILLSLAALAVGLAVSLPVGILVSRKPKLAEATLTVAGIIQTVPSLALLALMVLLLGLIGFEPAFVALTLYSVLPMLANTITGLRGVDPVLIEAGRGLGMNQRQMLFRVELPLAAPVIIAGIRTATVLVVGTATLVSPVGGRSLGNYIFQGLESINYRSTVFGCILAAVLAIVLDQLVHVLELAARRRSRPLAWIGGLGLFLVLVAGLIPLFSRYLGPEENWAMIGSGPFTEQHVLSEVLQRKLEAAGFHADKRRSMSEGIQLMALRRNQIDCMVNYSGNIWTLVMKREDFADRQTVLDEVTLYLRDQEGLRCLGSLGFENAYALAMPRREAQRLGVRTIADLARHAPRLRLASDYQFLGRPEWFKVRDAYRLQFADSRGMEQTLMYDAVAEGAVDVIIAYTSDGRIKRYDLVILEDPLRAFPPYDAILLVSPQAAARPGFIEALRPLVGGIDLQTMRDANYRVDVDQWTAPRAAEELLRRVRKGPDP